MVGMYVFYSAIRWTRIYCRKLTTNIRKCLPITGELWRITTRGGGGGETGGQILVICICITVNVTFLDTIGCRSLWIRKVMWPALIYWLEYCDCVWLYWQFPEPSKLMWSKRDFRHSNKCKDPESPVWLMRDVISYNVKLAGSSSFSLQLFFYYL